MPQDKKHTGAKSELLACAWLLSQGYEVFRNVSPFGDVDIVALQNGASFLFDVKTPCYRKNGEVLPALLRQSQIERGVIPLYVLPDGDCRIEPNPATLEHVLVDKPCEKCGLAFKPRHRRQIFCTTKCRQKAHRRRG